MKRYRIAGDVSELPTVVFGNRGILWWGTIAFMAIEGMTVAVCAASYLYVRKNFHDWPPAPTPLPSLLIPTIGVLVMLISIAVMSRIHVAAKRFDAPTVNRWMVVITIIGFVLVVLRWFDFRSINTRWDTDAYGSTAWATVAFHSSLLLFEAIETSVFTVLMLFGPRERKHFSDLEDNAIYWYFMCLIWIPVYFLVYISPRFL
jgi:heme/copper-type cytochrome/quinol oxidase subunit 3